MGAPLYPSLVVDDQGFRAMVASIVADHRTFGPRVRDASIVLGEIDSPDDLASGVALDQAPGRCRVVPLADGDSRRFAWAVGPQSAKSFQHPPEQTLFTADVADDGFEVTPVADSETSDGRPLAIIGLRPCDVAAVGVLDRVLGTTGMGEVDPLVVVVNCAEPGGTCFCVSMDTGPALGVERAGTADLVVWERGAEGGLEYLVTSTSDRGDRVIAELEVREATAEDVRWAATSEADAAARMGRRLDTDRLAERLTSTLGSARWNDVAERCLSCGNCTMVCPTCFCSSTHDLSALDGSTVSRTRRWDSCFTLEHSFIHGGSVRSGTPDRYRQWLTHKLSTWWAQFGESGCVGCGRCIAWCPVGIDLVEEANGLLGEARAEEATAGRDLRTHAPETDSVTEVLVRRREASADRVSADEGRL